MRTRKKWINPTSKSSGGALAEYNQWWHIVSRCRVGGYYQASNPTYEGCTFASSWESYDVWVTWARDQVGFLERDAKGALWQIDKDILFKGNKHYSPDTCVFVPREINLFYTERQRFRGDYPKGVYFKKTHQKYVAQVQIGQGSQKHLGVFHTADEAFSSYREAKAEHAKQLAIKYAGLVDPRVIDALNNYEVGIDD